MGRESEKLNSISSGMMRIALRIFLDACLIFVFFRGVTAAYRFGHDAFYAEGVEAPPGRDVVLTVKEGTDAAGAAELLKSRGLLKNVWAFRIQSAFFDLSIKPGTYELNTSETVRELLEELNTGQEETTESE